MQKILCLPKITIREMEAKVMQQRTTHKKYGYQENCGEGQNHQSDITLTSPFYERTHYKQKCECQFHRLKRATFDPNKHFERTKQNTINEEARVRNIRQSKEKEIIVQMANRFSQAIHVSPNIHLRPSQIKLPVKMVAESEVSEYQNMTTIPNSISSHIQPSSSLFKMLKSRRTLQVSNETVNNRIDTLNRWYIQLISERLQNEKFKEKYLKTLFGFIKMKTNQNKKYMQNSKAYIHNSLNKLLNHYSMDKLLQFQNLSEEQIVKIGHYMNCFPQKVKDILFHLRNAVCEMEKVLAQIRRKRKLNSQNEALDEDDESKKTKANSSQNSLKQPSDQHEETNQLLVDDTNPNKNQIEDQNLQAKDRRFSQIDQNKSTIANIYSNLQSNIESGSNHNLQKENSYKQKLNASKKSIKKINDLPSNSFLKNQSNQSKPIVPRQPVRIVRKSIRVSRNSQQIQNRRSFRSSVCVIVDDNQREKRFAKSKRNTKLKKAKIKQKDSLFDQKYAAIPYEKYMTRQKLQYLINQIERIDLNDTEKAQVLFKELNAEYFLDNQGQMEELLVAFKPLFNEQSLRLFLKQVVRRRDKRYIEKLQRELDDMLQEIKKNDPRMKDVDFFDVKPFKKAAEVVANKKMSNCHQLAAEKKQKVNRLNYYEAEQQIERHKLKQKSIKKSLEQMQLRPIRFDLICPSRSQVITHSQSPNNNLNSISSVNLRDSQAQKRILRYMKSKHQETFNYLANQFQNLCRSLSKQDNT